MKKLFSILAIVAAFGTSVAAYAQLPANPWAINPNDGDFRGGVNYDNTMQDSVTEAPIYDNTANGREILPVDPWAKARDKSGTETWRGSGQHGRLDYIGEATTFGDAQGQEMIAPEVNRHNMLVATQHLRDLGYKIPAGYDEKIRNLPETYRKILRHNYDKVHSADDPFGRSFVWMMEGFEQGTGLDLENILFNSLDILGTD
jgi:hypothetical protein